MQEYSQSILPAIGCMLAVFVFRSTVAFSTSTRYRDSAHSLRDAATWSAESRRPLAPPNHGPLQRLSVQPVVKSRFMLSKGSGRSEELCCITILSCYCVPDYLPLAIIPSTVNKSANENEPSSLQCAKPLPTFLNDFWGFRVILAIPRSYLFDFLSYHSRI